MLVFHLSEELKNSDKMQRDIVNRGESFYSYGPK
jgi:hypothetical protein